MWSKTEIRTVGIHLNPRNVCQSWSVYMYTLDHEVSQTMEDAFFSMVQLHGLFYPKNKIKINLQRFWAPHQ